MSAAAAVKQRIVVVGGGAGGAELVAALGRGSGRRAMDVTLVDCVASHLWKPRLHEVAAGRIGAGADEIQYFAMGTSNNFRFHLGALTSLDSVAQTISVSRAAEQDGAENVERVIAYDKLVLAFGSQVNDFGIPGVADHCHMLDSAEQALAFNQQFLQLAARVADGRLDRIRIGIVGAGATGVELAAELYRTIAMVQAGGPHAANPLDITLIDMADRVLANSAVKTSIAADRALQRMGVHIRLSAAVERVTAEGLVLKDGEDIPCDLKVWASGVIGRPLAERPKPL